MHGCKLTTVHGKILAEEKIGKFGAIFTKIFLTNMLQLKPSVACVWLHISYTLFID